MSVILPSERADVLLEGMEILSRMKQSVAAKIANVRMAMESDGDPKLNAKMAGLMCEQRAIEAVYEAVSDQRQLIKHGQTPIADRRAYPDQILEIGWQRGDVVRNLADTKFLLCPDPTTCHDCGDEIDMGRGGYCAGCSDG